MTLNEYIGIYSQAETADAYGTLSGTRTLIANCYAQVKPMSGSERNRQDSREAYADYRFWIHNRSDLGEADVIVWDGVDYNIRFIGRLPKDVYIYIDAQKGGAM